MGCHGRPDNVTYREALHATYQGPYTLGKPYVLDGLTSNTSGLWAATRESRTRGTG